MPIQKRKNKTPKISRLSGKESAKFTGEGRTNRAFSLSVVQDGHLFNVVRKREQEIENNIYRLQGINSMNSIARNKLIASNKLWYVFYKAGLPVPEYRKIDLRTGKASRIRSAKDSTPIRITNPNYLSAFERNMGGKKALIKGHEMDYGRPVFFSTLLVEKDSNLIKNLARDIAKIHSLGYKFKFLDFFGFRKKGNTFERAIIDFDPENIKKVSKEELEELIPHVLNSIKFEMGEKEFRLFLAEYLRNTKSRKIRKLILSKNYLKSKFKNILPGQIDTDARNIENQW